MNGALQNKFDRWDYSLSQLVSEIQEKTVFRFIVKHITRPLDKIFKSNQVKFYSRRLVRHVYGLDVSDAWTEASQYNVVNGCQNKVDQRYILRTVFQSG